MAWSVGEARSSYLLWAKLDRVIYCYVFDNEANRHRCLPACGLSVRVPPRHRLAVPVPLLSTALLPGTCRLGRQLLLCMPPRTCLARPVPAQSLGHHADPHELSNYRHNSSEDPSLTVSRLAACITGRDSTASCAVTAPCRTVCQSEAPAIAATLSQKPEPCIGRDDSSTVMCTNGQNQIE